MVMIEDYVDDVHQMILKNTYLQQYNMTGFLKNVYSQGNNATGFGRSMYFYYRYYIYELERGCSNEKLSL